MGFETPVFDVVDTMDDIDAIVADTYLESVRNKPKQAEAMPAVSAERMLEFMEELVTLAVAESLGEATAFTEQRSDCVELHLSVPVGATGEEKGTVIHVVLDKKARKFVGEPAYQVQFEHADSDQADRVFKVIRGNFEKVSPQIEEYVERTVTRYVSAA